MKDFIEFLSKPKDPGHELKLLTRKDIVLSFKKRQIISRFVFYQLLGGLFSLTVCPQFGLGLAEGHGISHYFRTLGDGACAVFCAFVFLSSGALISYLGMKGEELWWMWARYKQVLFFFPAFLWGCLMLTNGALKLEGESLTYHLSWLVTAALLNLLWLKLRSGIYVLRHAH